MLINQTWEKFDAVFEAKSRAAAFLHASHGTQNMAILLSFSLHRRTTCDSVLVNSSTRAFLTRLEKNENPRLKFLWLFSSTSVEHLEMYEMCCSQL